MDEDEIDPRRAALEASFGVLREAHREWRVGYEVESTDAYQALDPETRMKVVFHVFRMLMEDVGSYRYLIYEKLGFGMEAYGVLFDGLDINNALVRERGRRAP